VVCNFSRLIESEGLFRVTGSYMQSLKPPAPPHPLQDFKALYKCCIIIIIIMVALCNRADHNIFIL